MQEAELLALLSRVNTWWDGDEVPDSLRKATHRRRDFYKIRERIRESPRQILTLRGPRQVGKTTLCGQLIESLLTERKVPQQRLLYLSIENSRILSEPEGVIENALETYRERILQRSFRDVEGTIYVFLDEVQKAPDWADTLKYYTDTYSNLQFVATGSISTLIESDAGDTLIGRMDEQLMFPLKFVDYVRYDDTFENDNVYEDSTELRASLKESLHDDNPTSFTGELSRFYGTRQDIKPRLKALTDEYLLKGGYPGVLDVDIAESYQHLDTDLRNTVTGDLSNVFDVPKPAKVLKILSLLADSEGSKISKASLAESADIHRETVDRYLDHLEDFFLINRVPKYAGSEYASGGWPKIYLQDVGLHNTLAGALSERTLQNPEAMGGVLETAVCDHTRRLQFNLSNAQNADIYYNDERGEVDFVVEGAEYLLPIEVKNGDSTERNLRGLEAFVDRNDLSFGLCVNNADVLEYDGTVVHVPAWLYLFFC
jgi:predicted AAA+ superfamily ATPase